MSTNPSTDHEKHEQSHDITGKMIKLSLCVLAFYLLSLASVSDVLVSTKPSTDHKRHEQSHSVSGKVTKMLNYVTIATMSLYYLSPYVISFYW